MLSQNFDSVINLLTFFFGIVDYLAKGYLPSKILTRTNKVNNLIIDSKFYKGISRRAKYCYKDISSDNFVVMAGVSWSDDFEPNSMSKANCKSVFIKPLTFFSNNLYSNSLENTYPISIASKNENHDEIEKKC